MLIVPGLHVKIYAMQEDSSRKQNRIRGRGCSGFIVKGGGSSVIALGNAPGVLLMSVSDSERGRDPWIGWLPSSEIDITHWKD